MTGVIKKTKNAVQSLTIELIFYVGISFSTVICLWFLFYILSMKGDLAEQARREGFDENVRF